VAGPARTCAVCRKVGAKKELLRFVLVQKTPATLLRELALDLSAVLPGRGAYCHLRAQCLLDPKAWTQLVRSINRSKSRGGSEAGGKLRGDSEVGGQWVISKVELRQLLSQTVAEAATTEVGVRDMVCQLQQLLLETATKPRKVGGAVGGGGKRRFIV